MKFLLSIFLILLSFSQVQAETQQHMLGGGTSAVLAFGSGDSEFEAELAYDYSLSNGFQIGTELSVSTEGSLKIYTVLPTLTYNFFSDERKSLTSALFVELHAGLIHVSVSSLSATEFIYGVGFGKRFELAKNIAWSPSLSVLHTPGISSADPIFSISLFRLDVAF